MRNLDIAVLSLSAASVAAGFAGKVLEHLSWSIGGLVLVGIALVILAYDDPMNENKRRPRR